MTKNDIILAVIINIVLLIIIISVVFIWQKRQPMTAKKLRRQVKSKIELTQENPFKDDFCRTRMMLAVIEEYVPHDRTIAALLVDWTQKGWICLEKTPKKRLKSFGESEQESIRFINYNPELSGAELMLFEMLAKWADDTDILQKSELYQLARQEYKLVLQRMEQFIIQGKHLLRSKGEMQPEQKRRHFGFVDEQRAIFTSRGVREAAQLLGYQNWLRTQDEVDSKLWRDAILLESENCISDKQMLSMAKIISQTIISAANAGSQSKR